MTAEVRLAADAARRSALVAQHVAEVRRRIAASGGSDAVEILAVTKGFGADAVLDARRAGCRMIGESYAQELLAKLADVGADDRERRRSVWPEVHFIGRLQSRKVRAMVGAVDVWQSIDRAALIDELARRAGAGTKVMIQVNVSDEPQKGGCVPGDTAALVAHARGVGLDVVGLMTIGKAGPAESARAGFRRLRELAGAAGVRQCSMGMSEDLEVAVEEGSTMVRVGTALFGPRTVPHAQRPPLIDAPK